MRLRYVHLGGFRPSDLGGRAGRVTLLLLVLIGCHAPGPGADLVESVIAVVDEEPILRTEIEAQLEMALYSMGIDPNDAARVGEIREQVLDQQIDQLVLYQEAVNQQIPVDESEVGKAVNEAIARNRQEIGSQELFLQQLELEGLTEEELRERYSRQARIEMMVGRLMHRDLNVEVSVSEAEVRAYFDEHQADLPRREAALHLQHIVIGVSADTILVDKAQSLARQIAAQIRSDELSFADAARRYSDDPNGRTGGDLRRVSRGDFAQSMGPDFEDALFELEVGQISEPLPSPLGFHLVSLQEKDPAGAWVHPSHILFRVPVVRADVARAETEAQEVYTRAQAGESFEELARRYSDEPESGARGGDLGWIPTSTLTDQAAELLPQLAEGEITPPLPTDGFFHIFRLIEREGEREYAYEEVATELTNVVREQKRMERYEEWVAEVKQRHYIKRNPWGED